MIGELFIYKKPVAMQLTSAVDMGSTLKLREFELGIWGHLGDALGAPMACTKYMRAACELGGPESPPNRTQGAA